MPANPNNIYLYLHRYRYLFIKYHVFLSYHNIIQLNKYLSKLRLNTLTKIYKINAVLPAFVQLFIQEIFADELFI